MNNCRKFFLFFFLAGANFIVRDPAIYFFQEPSAASSSFLLRPGFLYFEENPPAIHSWRWITKDGAGESSPFQTALTEIPLEKFLLETVLAGGGAPATSTRIKLQFSKTPDFAEFFDVAEAADCLPRSVWCRAEEESENDILGLAIRNSGAEEDTIYFFRLFDVNAGKALEPPPGVSQPSIFTGKSRLEFTISGLPANFATEGIVTDIDTAPDGVPFGSLNFNEEKKAAQRLTVTTGARQGYHVFMFQRQGFLGPNNAEIDPIRSVNEVPASWLAGCPDNASGCYGYHAGDDTLAGGSARFAADDSFARLEKSPKEVSFSAVPVRRENIDIVFRVKVSDGQPGGDYKTSIVYLIVPVF